MILQEEKKIKPKEAKEIFQNSKKNSKESNKDPLDYKNDTM